MIYIIDDDQIMAECIARAVANTTKNATKTVVKNTTSHVSRSKNQLKKNPDYKIFTNAIEAMNEIAAGELPDLIFLDILLDGPDGFTFLNELVSYDDTAKIPVVIISSLDFSQQDLSAYGVVGQLSKDTMKPEDIKYYVEKYTR